MDCGSGCLYCGFHECLVKTSISSYTQRLRSLPGKSVIHPLTLSYIHMSDFPHNKYGSAPLLSYNTTVLTKNKDLTEEVSWVHHMRKRNLASICSGGAPNNAFEKALGEQCDSTNTL